MAWWRRQTTISQRQQMWTCGSIKKRRRRKLATKARAPFFPTQAMMMTVFLVFLTGQIACQPGYITNTTTADDKCGAIESCGDCVKTSLGCSWCTGFGRCLSPGAQSLCMGMAYTGPAAGCTALPSTPDDSRCAAVTMCGSCVRSNGCAWCPFSKSCMADDPVNARSCSQGFSNRSCFETCGENVPLHDSSGVIQLGAQGIGSPMQYPVYYLPHETCVYTIWPFPEGSTSRRMTIIRLQFEYVDLALGDYVELFANGLEGQPLMKITSVNAPIMVNKVITSRSNSVSLRFVSTGDQYATGFRATYKVIQGSPLDVYLISAIVTVSILSCILCSCCCNNWLSVIVGQSSRLAGTNGPARLLSLEEKNRIPTTAYSHPENGKMDVTECCICLADFEVGETVRKLPCSHLFHPGCIDTWLEFNTLCPLCKQDVRSAAEEAKAGSGHGLPALVTRCLCCGRMVLSRGGASNNGGGGSNNSSQGREHRFVSDATTSTVPVMGEGQGLHTVEMVELEAGTWEEERAEEERRRVGRSVDEEIKEEARWRDHGL